VTHHSCITCQGPIGVDERRCKSCQRAQQIARLSPRWQRESELAIARAPWCALCASNDGLTTDYVSGLGVRVLCSACDAGSQTTTTIPSHT
jgi:hypothetical protein